MHVFRYTITSQCIRIVALGILVCSIISSGAQPSPIWGELKKGPHHVGFKAIYTYDYSRVFHQPQPITGAPFPGETARPIRIFVWYPADAAISSGKMKYGEYIRIQPDEKSFESFNHALNEFDNWATLNWTDHKENSINKILNLSTEAVKDAPSLPGKFPLVVHFIGLNNRRNENIPFWEYLASHGYIVVTIPQFSGAGDVSMELWGFSEWGKETNVRDMEFAISQLRGKFNIDYSNIGAIGFSYGSVFAMRMAMTNFNIKTLITWDGNVNHKNGHRVIESFYNPKIKVDWLNVYRANYADFDPKVLQSLEYTNRYRVTIAKGSHGDFEDVAIAASLLPSQAPVFAIKERSLKTGKENYEATCSLSLAFLDHSLKKDQAAPGKFAEVLEQVKKNGIVQDVEIMKAKEVIDDEDLAHIIIYYGEREADLALEKARGNPNCEVMITSAGLLEMAKALKMGGRRLQESNQVLRFLDTRFPPDIEVQLELARNLIELKLPREAKQCIDKALKIDEKNQEALQMIQSLPR